MSVPITLRYTAHLYTHTHTLGAAGEIMGLWKLAVWRRKRRGPAKRTIRELRRTPRTAEAIVCVGRTACRAYIRDRGEAEVSTALRQ